MKTSRIEAFSDGVLAIVITIMVLELKVPHEAELAALIPVLPVFAAYVLSFIYVGIYWNNHHHLFQAVEHVTGAVLWANLHLLFWLSLIPFVTGWVGDTGLTPWPAAAYGVVLMMAAFAWLILARTLSACEGNELVRRAVGNWNKEVASFAAYLLAILLAYWVPWLSALIYAVVAALWLVPDRRFERVVASNR